MQNQYSRTQLLLGAEAMEKLHNSRVAVFGIGNEPVIFLIAVAAVWPVLINTAAGVRAELLQRLRHFAAHRKRLWVRRRAVIEIDHFFSPRSAR